MTPPRRLKPVTLLACAGGLVAVILWVTPGALGRWSDRSATGQGDATGSTGQAGPAGKASTRPRERPPAPDKAERLYRHLMEEIPGLRNELGFPNQEKREAFQAMLRAMTTEEFLAILDQMESPDADDIGTLMLAGAIAKELKRRDPEAAMDIFVARIPRYPQALEGIFSSWSFFEPAAAAGWLDRQVAQGVFAPFAEDGEIFNPRVSLESMVIRRLAAKDPAAAAARLAAQAPEVRERLLAGDWFTIDVDERKAVADFLRTHYEDRTSALAKASSESLYVGSLADITNFMEHISASPEERAAIMNESLRTRLTERVVPGMEPEEAREWIMAEALPEDADRLVGMALGEMMRWHKFPEMSALALQHREQSGSDDVLVAFLKSAPAYAREDILKLAAELTDPAARAEIAGRFTGSQAPEDPDSVLPLPPP